MKNYKAARFFNVTYSLFVLGIIFLLSRSLTWSIIGGLFTLITISMVIVIPEENENFQIECADKCING